MLGRFVEILEAFNLEDTDDRDQLARYLERIMSIVGIDGSGGLLNQWRYGFQPRLAPN
jgi:hypothetical protein